MPNFSYHPGTEENREEREDILSQRRDFGQKTHRQERAVLYSECEIRYFSDEKKIV